MAKAQPETYRMQLVVALKTYGYLELLAKKGTHGTNANDVAKSLIEQGIGQSIKDGFLTADDIKIVQAKS